MSGFSSHWLALREPLDLAARSKSVEDQFLKLLPAENIRILDLASGAGSTVSALARRFTTPVEWHLTDYDRDLLKVAVARRYGTGNFTLSIQQVDLAADLETLDFQDVSAVTTSAFLDLVSESFLQRLVKKVVQSGKPFLGALSYDGRAEFEPAHMLDTELRNGLNRHQKTDKGFGLSLGPDAAQRAIELFAQAGYQVLSDTSDWEIDAGKRDFLIEFLGGWQRVGKELGLEMSKLEDWWQDRSSLISDGSLGMNVGHIDFVAFPPQSSAD